MSLREARPAQRPGAAGRTLHHPSFLPLYMTAHFGRQHSNSCDNQTAHPIIPAEFFYSDPGMERGTRIPNAVTDLRVLEFFQLNTPAPLMSTGLASPNTPDPFRCGPHATRDLGSAGWSLLPHRRPARPRQVIVQLSQEEDQAITNLLKLHHQSPLVGSESFTAAKPDLSSAVDFNSRPSHQTPAHHSDLQQGRAWSDSELEAANTLLSCFMLSRDKTCDQKSEFVPNQLSSSGTETRHGSEAEPAPVTGPPTQKHTEEGAGAV